MENKASVQMRPCGSEKNGEWACVGNGVKVQFCSLHNVSTNQQNHRRSLSSEERQSYLKAVQCLHELPPKLKNTSPQSIAATMTLYSSCLSTLRSLVLTYDAGCPPYERF